MTATHTTAHIPDEAVQAGAEAIELACTVSTEEMSRAAISAALPHLSAPCAVEVESRAKRVASIHRKKDDGTVFGSFHKETAEVIEELLSCVVTKPVDVAAVREKVAREICLSYGQDPDDYASLCDVCGPNNEPRPQWHMYTEQAEAAIRALSAEPALGDRWQPIETAPKDGAWILAFYHKDCVPAVIFYDDEWKRWAGCADIGSNHFTHWMPLPAVPITEAGK